MAEQNNLDLNQHQQEDVNEYKFEPIKGYPMLNWKGKRPFTSTQYYPAQKKEEYGEAIDGWMNKIFWGDNIQVMSHLLKEFRGGVNLIYIDPPFDSKADYKKKIKIRNEQVRNDTNSFEEKQYTDIWNNDEYLQFMYERISLCRELLAQNGSFYIHVGPNISHYIKIICDELFGKENFVNEIVWRRAFGHSDSGKFGTIHDVIFLYGKSSKDRTWNVINQNPDQGYIDQFFDCYDEERGERYQRLSLSAGGLSGGGYDYEYKGVRTLWRCPKETLVKHDTENRLHWPKNGGVPRLKKYESEYVGPPLQDIWTDISKIHNQSSEQTGYPTQKPEELAERIIKTSSNPGDIILDCFMGSGTTLFAAIKNQRRFIGADINLGAIQIATKRIVNAFYKDSLVQEDVYGLEIFNVNNYDLFRNPAQAKELIMSALEIQKLNTNSIYDGEKDGKMYKIMPINRIATKADLKELVNGFNYKIWESRQFDNPSKSVETIVLVCMGHEPDLRASLELEAKPFKITVEVVDILRENANLEFKRDSEARIEISEGRLIIRNFYPMNLLQKLSLQKENVDSWKELVESIMIDWNYDGAILQPKILDIPDKASHVYGDYKIPEDAGTIRVKITDLISEVWEGNIDG